jgi:formylmethanofuran dehydrogenase subunit E
MTGPHQEVSPPAETSRQRIGIAIVCASLLAVLVAATIAFPARGDDPAPDLWERIAAFHGDLCLGSVMGARIGLAAKSALKEAGGEGRLKSTYYDLSCPVDGIQVAVGTTYGGGNLTVIDRDEHRLALTADGNGREVEAQLTGLANDKGATYRVLKGKARALSEGSEERRAVDKEMATILEWFKTAPDADVVSIRIVR